VFNTNNICITANHINYVVFIKVKQMRIYLLNKAIEISARAHSGQNDKAGSPYILHPLRAMLSLENKADRICAVLHDVIEDSDTTLDDLRAIGFSAEVLDALNSLTKKAGESYDEFIDRVIKNKIACRVKLADLSDNMDLTRILHPSPEDIQRVEKYKRASARILDALFNKVIPSP